MAGKELRVISRPRYREKSSKGTVLTFGEGVWINTAGKLRIIRLNGGIYVTGEGHLIPVATREEGERIICLLRERGQRSPKRPPLPPGP
jgi:hypothetical protein